MKNTDICDQSLVGIIVTCVKDLSRKKLRGLTVVRDKYTIQKQGAGGHASGQTLVALLWKVLRFRGCGVWLAVGAEGSTCQVPIQVLCFLAWTV